MLQSLTIKNVALIKDAELELGRGLNVLTGETGAGKSIILGSLGLIMGDKPTKGIIRTGETSARVDAVFSISRRLSSVLAQDYGIEADDDTIIITRSLKLDAAGLKSDCRINGSAVTTAILKEVAGMLVHIHGQHDTEVLLKPKSHIHILDAFGGEELSALTAKYQEIYSELKNLEKKLNSFGGNEEERSRQIDIYQFQIKEIESANLALGEEEILQEKKNKMQNFERITTNLSQTNHLLNEEEGALSLFGRALSTLAVISGFDERLEKIHEDANALQYGLDEFATSVCNYLEEMNLDEEEFERVDARLDELKTLRRKYGGSIEKVLEFLSGARAEYDRLLKSDKEVELTKKAIQDKLGVLVEYGKELTVKRGEVATRLEMELVTQLRDLGMPSATFNVGIVSDSVNYSKYGLDDVQFLFSANAGEPLKPLSSVASGGELSRFMLGLKTILSAREHVTMIFDEIDTGIGGEVGISVGRKISDLAKNSQVVAVTHLPQIAAAADVHFLIEKKEETIQGAEVRTKTTVRTLDDEGSLRELSRMVGGAGETAVNHAKALRKMLAV